MIHWTPISELPAELRDTDITPEWLQSIGFESFSRNSGDYRILASPLTNLWNSPMVEAEFISGKVFWHANGNELPVAASPKTRAEVLRLVAAMGHTVKDGVG
jgi:hypothetical protein